MRMHRQGRRDNVSDCGRPDGRRRGRDRPAALCVESRDLYRSARSTIREVGSGRYVLDDGFVLGEVPAVKTNILPAGAGVFVEWGFISLVQWATVRLIVDRLTKPGETLLTALVFFDLGIRDAKAIVLIDAA